MTSRPEFWPRSRDAEPAMNEKEMQAALDKLQQTLLDTFALVHDANALIKILRAENEALSAALVLQAKGAA